MIECCREKHFINFHLAKRIRLYNHHYSSFMCTNFIWKCFNLMCKRFIDIYWSSKGCQSFKCKIPNAETECKRLLNCSKRIQKLFNYKSISALYEMVIQNIQCVLLLFQMFWCTPDSIESTSWMSTQWHILHNCFVDAS